MAVPVLRTLRRGHLQWPGPGSRMGVPGLSLPHCLHATRRTVSMQWTHPTGSWRSVGSWHAREALWGST
eukprot:15477648-Alexandrium_andersonii.AAC.1